MRKFTRDLSIYNVGKKSCDVEDTTLEDAWRYNTADRPGWSYNCTTSCGPYLSLFIG